MFNDWVALTDDAYIADRDSSDFPKKIVDGDVVIFIPAHLCETFCNRFYAVDNSKQFEIEMTDENEMVGFTG